MGTWEDIQKWLFGDRPKEDELRKQIDDAEARLRNIADSRERDTIIAQLKQLRGQLEAEMQKQGITDASGKLINPTAQEQAQGVTDASGRLLSAQNTQSQFLDQDYINQIKKQNMQNQSILASQAERAGRRAELQGGMVNPMQTTASLEGGLRTNQADTMGALKSESETAYNKAAQDLSNRSQYANALYNRQLTNLDRGMNYATQLTEYDRQALVAQLNTQLQQEAMQYNMTSSQLASLQNQLANMPAGALQTLAATALQGGAGALISALLGGSALTGATNALGWNK